MQSRQVHASKEGSTGDRGGWGKRWNKGGEGTFLGGEGEDIGWEYMALDPDSNPTPGQNDVTLGFSDFHQQFLRHRSIFQLSYF